MQTNSYSVLIPFAVNEKNIEKKINDNYKKYNIPWEKGSFDTSSFTEKVSMMLKGHNPICKYFIYNQTAKNTNKRKRPVIPKINSPIFINTKEKHLQAKIKSISLFAYYSNVCFMRIEFEFEGFQSSTTIEDIREAAYYLNQIKRKEDLIEYIESKSKTEKTQC